MLAHGDDLAAEVVHRLLHTSTGSARPQHTAEAPLLQPCVGGQLFHLMVEHAHHGRIPAGPDLLADVLGGHLIISTFDFDVAVAVDTAAAFFVTGEQTGWKWLQGRFLFCLEVGVDLTLGCAVDALVRHVGRPPSQVLVDLGEAAEVFAFEGVVFDVFNAGFDLAFVGGRVGARGQDYCAVGRVD